MSDAFMTAENLRTAMRAELEAISEYERFARETPFPQIRDLLRHIANEERHHVAEEFRALMMVDPDQAEAYKHVFGRKRHEHD